MGIRTIIKGFLGAFLFVLATSCDDDLYSVGESVQPEKDKINVGVDTLKSIKVETVKLDAINARAIKGVLGKYNDPIFGAIKSDYMCELFPAEAALFIDTIGSGILSIDSVFVKITIEKAIGDTISPAGLSIYQLTQELNKDINTDVNPLEYCDMKKVLGRGMFSVAETPYYGNYHQIRVPLDVVIGRNFYKMWQEDKSIFDSPENLKPYFPGMFVTHTYGADVLMTVNNTSLEIYYSFEGPNHDETSNDSTYVRVFRTGPSPEVIQVNSIENQDVEGLITSEDSPISYLKSPAGLYSKFKLPLRELAEIVGQDTIINTAKLSILGNTVQEQYSKFDRPTDLLFINKDSIDAFFSRKNNAPDNVTSFVITRTTSNNSYNFNNISSSSNASTSALLTSSSVANLFNYYLDKYRKDDKEITDIEYVLIPVSISASDVTDSSGNVSKVINSVSHSMSPTSAILNTSDITIPLVFSKFNERNAKK